MLTNIPFLLRRPAVYELNIIAAYAFLIAGFFYYLRAIQQKSRSSSFLILVGILFGLCIATRVNQIIVVCILILGYFVIRRFLFKEPLTSIGAELSIIIFPIALIGIALCVYNYIRFDSILEFGMKYQLSGIDTKLVPGLSLRRIGVGLYAYLFHSYQMDLIFPFIHILEPRKPETSLANIWFTERILGIFSYPFFYLATISIFAYSQIIKNQKLVASLLLIMILCSTFCLFSLTLIQGVTMRYMVDFLPLLLIALLVSFELSRGYIFKGGRIGGLVSSYLFYSSIICSSLISLFSSFSGTYDVLKIVNPALYDQLKSIFY